MKLNNPEKEIYTKRKIEIINKIITFRFFSNIVTHDSYFIEYFIDKKYIIYIKYIRHVSLTITNNPQVQLMLKNSKCVVKFLKTNVNTYVKQRKGMFFRSAYCCQLSTINYPKSPKHIIFSLFLYNTFTLFCLFTICFQIVGAVAVYLVMFIQFDIATTKNL